MKQQRQVSKNIIDKRNAATHGLSGILGIFIGCLVSVGEVDQASEAELVQVVSTALDRGQNFWSQRIPGWRDARVVLFAKQIDTPCGVANKFTGPFYCSADEHIYIDLWFLKSIDGDLGQAYVIAHEIGHHVQHLTSRLKSGDYRVELQADCFAGVWMAHENANNNLDPGDLEEAYLEAVQVGDTGPIDTWTHGDAEHRVAAIKRGFETGKCDL